VGDPTEGALLVAGAKAFIGRDAARERYPRVGEAAFTSERKRMSVIVEGKNNEFDLGAPYLMFVKGSPEVVMGLSTQALMGGQVVEVDQVRQRMLELNDRMASDGVRVLGFAYRPLDTVPPAGEEEKHEHDLVWIGLIGMIDAPRPEVREAVKVAGTAGIRPIMITGDHRLTALAIARDLGIARPNQDRVITGPELEAMPDEQLRKEVTEVNVFARVAPEHKLRIVRALQSHNQFVAMTGDGVNDAPALKQGNIGVAMGITGTDVTKEASDMILTDDNFASIISAVEEGRTIYGNVRKYVKYILTSNIGEVLTLAVTPLFGLPVPLLPMQTLYMNLVTDGVPALALAVDPPDPDVMKKKPYGPKESIFSRGLGAYMLRVGIVFGIIGILFTLYSARVLQSEAWRTMVFTMLCVAQMGHALVVRHERESIFRIGLLTNKWVLLAVGVTTALQLLLPYVPPLAEFFELKPMTAGELAICFAVSTLLFIYVELEKWVMRIRERNQKARGA
jgi:Ca2+-transporting ATPase